MLALEFWGWLDRYVVCTIYWYMGILSIVRVCTVRMNRKLLPVKGYSHFNRWSCNCKGNELIGWWYDLGGSSNCCYSTGREYSYISVSYSRELQAIHFENGSEFKRIDSLWAPRGIRPKRISTIRFANSRGFWRRQIAGNSEKLSALLTDCFLSLHIRWNGVVRLAAIEWTILLVESLQRRRQSEKTAIREQLAVICKE